MQRLYRGWSQKRGAAVVVQCAARVWRARVALTRARHENFAAKMIQRLHRGNMGRRYAEEVREQKRRDYVK